MSLCTSRCYHCDNEVLADLEALDKVRGAVLDLRPKPAEPLFDHAMATSPVPTEGLDDVSASLGGLSLSSAAAGAASAEAVEAVVPRRLKVCYCLCNVRVYLRWMLRVGTVALVTALLLRLSPAFALCVSGGGRVLCVCT